MPNFTVWYRCARCSDELAEYRDVSTSDVNETINSVPPSLVHECNEDDRGEQYGVALPYRVVRL